MRHVTLMAVMGTCGALAFSGCIPSPCATDEECPYGSYCDIGPHDKEGTCAMGSSTSSSSSSGGATGSSGTSGQMGSSSVGESSSDPNGSSATASSSGGNDSSTEPSSSGGVASSGAGSSSSGGASSSGIAPYAAVMEVTSPDETVFPGQTVTMVVAVTNTGANTFWLPVGTPTVDFLINGNSGTPAAGLTASGFPSCPDNCTSLAPGATVRFDVTVSTGDLLVAFGMPVHPSLTLPLGSADDTYVISVTAMQGRPWLVINLPTVSNLMATGPSNNNPVVTECPTLCFRLVQPQNVPMDVAFHFTAPTMSGATAGRATLANGALSSRILGGTHHLMPGDHCLAWNAPFDLPTPLPNGAYTLRVETRIKGLLAGSGGTASFTMTGATNLSRIRQCGSDFAAVLLTEEGPPAEASVLGDLNGDGNLDLVTANTAAEPTPQLLINFSAGAGAWRGVSVLTPGLRLSTAVALQVTDMNHDGLPDLVVADGVSNVTVFRQTAPPGTFSPPTVSSVGLFGSAAQLVAADTQGDGFPDLFIRSLTSPGLTIVSSVPVSMGLPPVFQGLSVDPGLTIRDMVAADFDKDGREDVLFIAATDVNLAGTVRVLWGGTPLTDAQVATQELFAPLSGSPLATCQMQKLVVGGFDTNNRPDLAIGSKCGADTRVSVVNQTGRRELTLGTDRLEPGYIMSLVVADVPAGAEPWVLLDQNGVPALLRVGANANLPILGALPTSLIGAVDVDEGNEATVDLVGFFGSNQPGTVRLRHTGSSGGPNTFRTETDVVAFPGQGGAPPERLMAGRFLSPDRHDLVTLTRRDTFVIAWIDSLSPSVGQKSLNPTLGGLVDAITATVVAQPARVGTSTVPPGPDQVVVATNNSLHALTFNEMGSFNVTNATPNNGTEALFPITTVTRLHRGRFGTITPALLDTVVVLGTDGASSPLLQSWKATALAAEWRYDRPNSTPLSPGAAVVSAVGNLGNVPTAVFSLLPQNNRPDVLAAFNLASTQPVTTDEVTSNVSPIRTLNNLVVLNSEVAFHTNNNMNPLHVVSGAITFNAAVGTLTASPERPQPGLSAAPTLLQTADLNADATEELLVQRDQQLQVRSRARDTTTLAIDYPVAMTLGVTGGPQRTDAAPPVVGDFDGDGKLDVALLVGVGASNWEFRILRGR